MKIMIVEDDRISACILRHLLEQQEYEVIMAENGKEAWEHLCAEPIPIVLSDWLMPEMDGLELCRRIRSQTHDSYTYVILLTAKDQREDRLAGMQAGADDFLIKPLDADELRARLKVARRILTIEAELKRKNTELENAAEQIESYLCEINKKCRELEVANAQLKALSITDGLTGLKNHREFQARLEDEINRATRYQLPLSLILIDVDRFKLYNDSFGHPAGDEVLRRVSQTLVSRARDTDFLARYGGEEFAIILANTDRESALIAAERFRTAIQQAEWDKRPVTVSMGVATLKLLPQTRAQLTAEADTALYASKHRGRNRVTHYADIIEEMLS